MGCFNGNRAEIFGMGTIADEMIDSYARSIEGMMRLSQQG